MGNRHCVLKSIEMFWSKTQRSHTSVPIVFNTQFAVFYTCGTINKNFRVAKLFTWSVTNYQVFLLRFFNESINSKVTHRTNSKFLFFPWRREVDAGVDRRSGFCLFCKWRVPQFNQLWLSCFFLFRRSNHRFEDAILCGYKLVPGLRQGERILLHDTKFTLQQLILWKQMIDDFYKKNQTRWTNWQKHEKNSQRSATQLSLTRPRLAFLTVESTGILTRV